MKTNYLFAIYFIIITLFISLVSEKLLYAQEEPRCAVKDLSLEEVLNLQDQIKSWRDMGGITSTTIISIPVAFHVVRRDDGSGDVSNIQIQRQLDSLNRGFSNTNFRFTLDTITRTNNTIWSTHTPGSPAESAMKQALARNPARTLNFYICVLRSGLLGYAQFPWSYPEDSYMHGVVVRNTTLPGGNFPYDEGDTGIHEVGHYCGLFHTFQNGCTPPGDVVEDTPYEASPAFGCPIGRNTCPQPGNDPIHNFMDYTDDNCMNHFTQGQSARMDTMMSLYRPSMVSIKVVVDQKIFNNSVDSVGRWEGGPNFARYAVPVEFLFRTGSTEVLRGSQKLISNHKYYLWSVNHTFNVTDVKNHHKFQIYSDMNNLTSHFHPTDPTITIRNELIDAPAVNGGRVELKDPWLVDVTDSRFYEHPYGYRNLGMEAPFKSETSPFRPTLESKYKGVFLNQEISPGLPYYSVRVPQSQRIGAYNSNFAYWTSSKGSEFQIPNALETGVVFKHANDTIKAVYKGHRISSTNAALEWNNLRKLVITPDYNLHLIYKSANNIWYTKSTNNGLNWQLEELVNQSLLTNSFSSSSASIGLVYPEYNIFGIVWEERELDPEWDFVVIYFREGSPYGLNSNFKVIDWWADYIHRESNPVLAYPMIIYRVYDVNYNHNGWYFNLYLGLGTWSGRIFIPFIPNYVDKVSAVPSADRSKIHLVYSDNGNIKYSKGNITYGYNWSVSWDNPITISNGNYNINPGIILDINGNPNIVYESFNVNNPQTKSIVYVRLGSSGNILNTKIWTNQNIKFENPSISYYANGMLAVTWQDSEKIYLVNGNINNNIWTDLEHYYGAYSGNLAICNGMIPIENAKFVYEQGNNQPYRISFGNAKRTPTGGGGGCPFVYVYNGSEYIEDNNILPQSEYTPKENGFVTDYYQLFKKPVVTNNTYKLRVAEFEEEISQLDKIGLIIVDHEPEASIGVSETGEISQYAKPVSLSNAQLDEDDVFKFVYELDENYIEAQRGSTLNLIFDRTQAKGFEDNKATEEALALVGIIEPPGEKDKIAGIFGQKTDGKLVNDNQFRLRRNPSFIWIPVESGGSKDGTTEVSISWQQNVKVDYTELSHQLDLPYSVYECELISAEHSTTGDVSEQLREIDNEIVELSPGQWVDLVFDAPELAEGKKRSFIFVSNGRYEKIEKMKERLALKKQKSKENNERVIPTEYSLHQNRPNPFNPITQIGYALPAAGHTTLKIYDVLGREVAVLVNEFKEAGEYEVVWDASAQPSGVYFYKLQSGNFIAVKKMLLVR